jgi:hypothetical protein
MNLRHKDAMLAERFVHVAGHEQCSRFWTHRSEMSRELRAIHVRHHHIGDEEIDSRNRCFVLDDDQRFRA